MLYQSDLSQKILDLFIQCLQLDKYLQENLASELQKRTIIRRTITQTPKIVQALRCFGDPETMTDLQIALFHQGNGALPKDKQNAQAAIASFLAKTHEKEEGNLTSTYLCETIELLNNFFAANLSKAFLDNVLKKAKDELLVGRESCLSSSFVAYETLLLGIPPYFPIFKNLSNICLDQLNFIKRQLINIPIEENSKCTINYDDILYYTWVYSTLYERNRVVEREIMNFHSCTGVIREYTNLMNSISQLQKNIDMESARYPDDKSRVLLEIKQKVLGNVIQYYISLEQSFYTSYIDEKERNALPNPDILFEIAVLKTKYPNLCQDSVEVSSINLLLYRFLDVELALSEEEVKVNNSKKCLAFMLGIFLLPDMDKTVYENSVGEIVPFLNESKLLNEEEKKLADLYIPACKFLYVLWIVKNAIGADNLTAYHAWQCKRILSNLAASCSFDFQPIVCKILNKYQGNILDYVADKQNFLELLFESFANPESLVPEDNSSEKARIKQKYFATFLSRLIDVCLAYKLSSEEIKDKFKNVFSLFVSSNFDESSDPLVIISRYKDQLSDTISKVPPAIAGILGKSVSQILDDFNSANTDSTFSMQKS